MRCSLISDGTVLDCPFFGALTAGLKAQMLQVQTIGSITKDFIIILH